MSIIDSFAPIRGTHGVQFYESEDFLCGVVAKFVADGLRDGELALVIATEEHREGISEKLRELGVTLSEVILLDARETLGSFMSGAMPDEERFREQIGGVLEKAITEGRHLRAYGEMVDVLWREGNAKGAIRLEQLWNLLLREYGFSLLCAYAIGNFYQPVDSGLFDEMCGVHTHVIPAESLPVEIDRRLREIASLQQRAVQLEAEVERRNHIERELQYFIEHTNVLLDITTTLHQSLDVNTRMSEAGNLIVPRLADGWAVDLRTEGDAVERIASAGVIDAPHAIAREPELTPPRMVVPINLNEKMYGAMTFVSSRPRYGEGDLRLASDIAQRTAIAIENARLYRLTQEANRAKDEFLATLSHELRTPLTAILGWAKMLTLGGLDAETMRTAHLTIERSAKTQAALIDDLLDLSKVVTGKLKLQTELVDLMTVVENAIQTLKLASEAKGITIDIGRTSDRTVVAGDPTRLQQIAWNLLSNAVKFSEAGARVTVSVDHRDGRARLVVRDHGRGISPEFLPHVFEAFRQADGASTRSHGGLGLGLAIVKYLAEAHGGTVNASSEGLGKGATFTVTLPLALRSSVQAAAVREDIVDLAGLHILLVDDDDDTRNVVAAGLRRCGAIVVTTESARGARNEIESKRPDFVITDIAMPLEDGLSLIKDLSNRPDPLTIVALSALPPPANGNGYRAWVRKPIDPLEFARVIADLR